MRALVVGVGAVATQNYLPFLAAQDDLELGYLNRTPSKAQSAADTFGGRAFVEGRDLLDWSPDVAFVLTSERDRYEAARSALELGIPRLFLEKPLVAERGQADVIERDFFRAKDLLDRASNAGCETAMVFNYRFFEQTQFARQTAEDRNFGRLTQFAAFSHYACWSHCIDLIGYFGGNLADVAASAGSVTRHGAGNSAVDIAASFTTEDGGTGTLLGTAGLAWQHPLFELSLNFEGGRIHLRDLDGTVEVFDAARNRYETFDLCRDTSRWDQYSKSFVASLAAYLGSIRADAPPPVPGIDGLRELRVEAGIKKSIAERRSVNLTGEYPL